MDAEQKDPSQKQDPLLVKLQERVRKASGGLKDERKKTAKRRKYMRGEINGGGIHDEGLVRSNLIYSTINNIEPLIYAKNPEVSIKPSIAVEDDAYEVTGKFCDTLEIVASRLLRDAGLKSKAKRTLRASLVTGQGWVKLSYQRDIQRDQAIINRIADAQDNMRRLQHEIKEIEEGNKGDREEELRQIELLTTSLEAKAEIVKAEGLALDTIRREDMIVDPAITGVSDYKLARWICQRIYMNKEDAESLYDMELDNATTYASDNEEPASNKDADKESRGDLIIVYEFWDRINNHVFTFVDGHNQWLREPYVPTRSGEQFFPFIPLVLLEDDEGKDLSMIDMLMELQDEYNTTRTNFAEARQANVAHWVVDSRMKVREVKSFEDAEVGSFVTVDTDGMPLDKGMMQAPQLRIDAGNYDTSQIRTDMDLVSGVQDAMRGGVGKAKTATEAKIMQAGASGRVGAMQDTVEDWLQVLFQLASEMLLQEMDIEQVRKFAGMGAVWTQMSKEDAFRLVNIEIRAGSAGKPDTAQDRDAWAQIMPLLQDMYVQITQIEMQGGNGEPLRKLMRETLKRFDERIDADEFIPPMQQPLQQQMPQQPMMNGADNGQGIGAGQQLGDPNGIPNGAITIQ